MTTQTLNQAGAYPHTSVRPLFGSFSLFSLNFELKLAVITLIALLTGWVGGSMLGLLPQWGIVLAAVIAFAAGGYSGLMGAIEEAREGKLDIDFLMLAAALGAALIGEWEEGALLLFLFTLSGALEEFALERTRHAIETLADLRPDVARVQRQADEDAGIRGAADDYFVAIDALQLGDIVIVKPGERLPVDGIVERGYTDIDQSAITGESMPVTKTVGSEVFAGTINGSGAIEVSVTKLASDSTLSKIIQLVSDAQEETVPTQQFIDRFSQPYTYVVIAATIVAILIPQLFTSEAFADSFYRAMTLLVVASPCALIISTPASVLSAIAAAARNGILLKGGIYLEKLSDVEIIAFDKTGTLTLGQSQVTEIEPIGEFTPHEVLEVAATAENLSEHLLAQAIIAKAKQEKLLVRTPDHFEAITGMGVHAEIRSADGAESIYVGNQALMEKLLENLSTGQNAENQTIPAGLKSTLQRLQDMGKTTVIVARQRKNQLREAQPLTFLGVIGIADVIRPETPTAIAQLQKSGIQKTVMLTGDHERVAMSIAQEVSVQEVYADLLPQEKVQAIRELSTEGKTAMIGDGINDAPALATAHVGIAMGAGGTDVALETADVVLMSSDLSKLPFALKLSRLARQIVRQNVAFALGVMLTLVVLTILLPIFSDSMLPLPLGVIGHEGSTLIVVMNGLRLLTMKE